MDKSEWEVIKTKVEGESKLITRKHLTKTEELKISVIDEQTIEKMLSAIQGPLQSAELIDVLIYLNRYGSFEKTVNLPKDKVAFNTVCSDNVTAIFCWPEISYILPVLNSNNRVLRRYIMDFCHRLQRTCIFEVNGKEVSIKFKPDAKLEAIFEIGANYQKLTYLSDWEKLTDSGVRQMEHTKKVPLEKDQRLLELYETIQNENPNTKMRKAARIISEQHYNELGWRDEYIRKRLSSLLK